MTEFIVSMRKSPDLTEDEIRRRLSAAYRLILSWSLDNETAERVQPGRDTARSAVIDAPTTEAGPSEGVYSI